MNSQSNSKYLESKVLTASQPQLHLMLLEGAVRFGQRAAQMWNDPEQVAAADELVARLLEIVEELSRSTSGRDNEISLQLEEQYAFLYRELTSCRVNKELDKLESCLELLHYQRDTWKQVCEQIEFSADTNLATPAVLPPTYLDSSPGTTSFSLDA